MEQQIEQQQPQKINIRKSKKRTNLTRYIVGLNSLKAIVPWICKIVLTVKNIEMY